MTKNVHLVVFHGLLSPEENKGQKIWSPDNGKTKYALVLSDLCIYVSSEFGNSHNRLVPHIHHIPDNIITSSDIQ